MCGGGFAGGGCGSTCLPPRYYSCRCLSSAREGACTPRGSGSRSPHQWGVSTYCPFNNTRRMHTVSCILFLSFFVFRLLVSLLTVSFCLCLLSPCVFVAVCCLLVGVRLAPSALLLCGVCCFSLLSLSVSFRVLLLLLRCLHMQSMLSCCCAAAVLLLRCSCRPQGVRTQRGGGPLHPSGPSAASANTGGRPREGPQRSRQLKLAAACCSSSSSSSRV